MKRIIFLLLALVMCLSLCACGGNDAPSTPEASEEPTTTPVEEDNITLVELNEPFTIGDYEFVINQCSYKESLEPKLWVQLQSLMSKSEHYVEIDFTITYKGKTAVWGHTQDWYSLNYNDGYILTDGHGLYEDASFSSGWEAVSVSTEFQPMSEAKTCKWFFAVNKEVVTNESAPLLFVINIDGEEMALDLRNTISN